MYFGGWKGLLCACFCLLLWTWCFWCLTYEYSCLCLGLFGYDCDRFVCWVLVFAWVVGQGVKYFWVVLSNLVFNGVYRLVELTFGCGGSLIVLVWHLAFLWVCVLYLGFKWHCFLCLV